MGMIALPTMLRNGYSPQLASGVVCTAGTLGQIIPPSTLLIILSDVMSNAYQQAQYEKGLLTIDTISVGQTFAAALVPGLRSEERRVGNECVSTCISRGSRYYTKKKK